MQRHGTIIREEKEETKKVVKRPHRSGSIRMVRNKPNSIKNTREVNVEPSMPLQVTETEVQAKPNPLIRCVGTFGGEAWEEFRATLLRLRQADAEDNSIK